MSNANNLANAISQSKIDSEIITGTLDKLNSTGCSAKKCSKSSGSSMSEVYNLSKDVLSSYYEAKGSIINETSKP